MRRSNHYQLRNPLFILMSFVVLQMPEFSLMCSLDLPFQPFWGEVAICGQEFVFYSFLEKSVWSLFLIVITFETFLRLKRTFRLATLPDTALEWVTFQARLFIVLILAFSFYAVSTLIIAAIVPREWQPDLITDLKKNLFIGFLSINTSVLIQIFGFRRDPLSFEINVSDDLGRRTVLLKEVKWFEKKGRNYYAHTGTQAFKIDSNLQAIERMFSEEHFIRINRAVIANISAIHSYAYWENEKYIVRMHDNGEFVASRKRIVELKQRMNHRL